MNTSGRNLQGARAVLERWEPMFVIACSDSSRSVHLYLSDGLPVNSSNSRLSAWKIFATYFPGFLVGRRGLPLTCLLVSMLSRIRMRVSPLPDVLEEPKSESMRRGMQPHIRLPANMTRNRWPN